MKRYIALVGMSLLCAGTAVEAQRSRQTVAGIAQQEIGQGPKVTVLGGVAAGEDTDFGVFLAATFGWPISDLPLIFRVDPVGARYGYGSNLPSGVGDGNLLLIGGGAALQYDFESSTGSRNTPYIMGGLGLYFARSSFDSNLAGVGGSDTETDLGISLGGGIRLGDKLVLEGRFMNVGSFTTIPLMIGYRP